MAKEFFSAQDDSNLGSNVWFAYKVCSHCAESSKLYKCGWLIIISPDQGGQAPKPSATTMIHSGGIEIEGELMHQDWQKLLDIFFSIMDKKGKKAVGLRGRTRSSRKRHSEEVTDNADDLHVLIANFSTKSNVFWVLFWVNESVLS